MSLAMIRDAGELTQVEVAKRMGVDQGTVSTTPVGSRARERPAPSPPIGAGCRRCEDGS